MGRHGWRMPEDPGRGPGRGRGRLGTRGYPRVGPAGPPPQTAQVAEVVAIWCAIRHAPRPLVIITDSKYVFNTVQRMQHDPTFDPGEHGHWWAGVRADLGRIKELRWQKAHLTREQNRAGGGTDRVGPQAACGRGSHCRCAGAH